MYMYVCVNVWPEVTHALYTSPHTYTAQKYNNSYNNVELSATCHNTDINECSNNSIKCYPEGTICNNTIGGYECVCPDGYILCHESYKCISKKTLYT